MCGGGVLGIVSPALPDDPDSHSTSPSVKGLSQSGLCCSRSPEDAGVRSPDALSALLRELASTITPGTTTGFTMFRLAIGDFAMFSVDVRDCPSFHSREYPFSSQHVPGEGSATESSKVDGNKHVRISDIDSGFSSRGN